MAIPANTYSRAVTSDSIAIVAMCPYVPPVTTIRRDVTNAISRSSAVIFIIVSDRVTDIIACVPVAVRRAVPIGVRVVVAIVRGCECGADQSSSRKAKAHSAPTPPAVTPSTVTPSTAPATNMAEPAMHTEPASLGGIRNVCSQQRGYR
jgi:hypothetical protein